MDIVKVKCSDCNGDFFTLAKSGLHKCPDCGFKNEFFICTGNKSDCICCKYQLECPKMIDNTEDK